MSNGLFVSISKNEEVLEGKADKETVDRDQIKLSDLNGVVGGFVIDVYRS